MKSIANVMLLLSVILGTACVQTPDQSQSRSASVTAPEKRTSVITVGVTASIPGLGGANIGGANNGISYTSDIHTVGLVAPLVNGTFEPRLAIQLPSLTDGSVVLLSDGTMQTTWKLRPDIVWHDGHPFTADDMVFGSQVYLDPEMGLRTPNLTFIDRVEAVDPLTIRIYWKSTYYNHVALGPKDLGPLPVHLLKEAFLSDKEKFSNHPYWNTDYVHLGPYRLIDFGLGERLTFEAFDRYFLGKPQIDRVIIQVVGDPSALYAQLLAGTVDVAPIRTISDDQAFQLRGEWQKTNGGRVFVARDQLDFLIIQFHPDRVALPELATDPRIRQGLFWGLDRETLREAVYPGFNTRADTFMNPSDPRNAQIGMPFARYRFDPQVAVQTLETAGWRRDTGGKLVRQNGEPVQLQVRGSNARRAKIAIIADMWRKLGVNIEEYFTPPALAQNREHNAMLPGVEWSARPTAEGLFSILLTRQIPNTQNNFGGANRGSYSNPRFDALADRFFATVNDSEQTTILKEIADIWALDFPIFPLQYAVFFTAVGQGIHTQGDGNDNDWDFCLAHLWYRQ